MGASGLLELGVGPDWKLTAQEGTFTGNEAFERALPTASLTPVIVTVAFEPAIPETVRSTTE